MSERDQQVGDERDRANEALSQGIRRRQPSTWSRYFVWAGFASVLAFSSVGATRPGLGGAPTGGTTRVGRGGLAIFYDEALRSRSSVSVEWSSPTLTVQAGTQTHQLELDDWQLAAALELALGRPDVSMLEVSVDELGGGRQTFFHSRALDGRFGPNPITEWLEAVDIAYAGIVQSVPDTAKYPELSAVAPITIRQRLLAEDDDYRLLTRDLVTMPSTWPQIEFHVSDLASSEPLRWKTHFQFRYRGPDGLFVDPEASKGFIEPWMVEQAERPYDQLRRGVETESATRDHIRAAIPEVEIVEEFAISLAALYAYCPTHRATCREWQSGVNGASAVPAPRTSLRVASERELDALARQWRESWDSAREAMWMTESDVEFRRWIFIDQVIWYFAGGTFPRRPFADLVPSDHGRKQTKVGLELMYAGLMTAAVAGKAPADASELRNQFNAIGSALATATKSNNQQQKELWRDRALLMYGSLVELLSDHPKTAARSKKKAQELFDRCEASVTKSSKKAANRPKSAAMDVWLYQLGRWQRCENVARRRLERTPAVSDLVMTARLHYAIGSRAAGGKSSKDEEHARNRLRLLWSTMLNLQENGHDPQAEQVLKLARKLVAQLS